MAGRGGRDVMVTGMGFCLPGPDGRVQAAADLWAVASRGRSGLTGRTADGRPHGTVSLPAAEFAGLFPDIPGIFAERFTAAHRFGLLALDAAGADAGLDHRAGELGAAAILTGRGGIDTMVGPYLALSRADFGSITAREAADHVTGALLGATPADVNLAQAALARSTGPCFTVAAGCASAAAQLGNAAALIATGAVSVAVVTGVDVLDAGLMHKCQQMTGALRQRAEAGLGSGAARCPPLPGGLMRPYDRRGGTVHYGEGAATLILESRQHADQRGARCYGRILAHAMARDGLPHPVSGDETKPGLVTAVRACLGERWRPGQVRYVHGASDGQPVITAAEGHTIRTVYGDAADGLLMTSQEACFGHNGAPAGCLSVALTLLMLERQQVCPTANCETPAPGLPFDPVPGTRPRPLAFDYALNFTFQAGGTSCVTLVGAPDAT
jgi:3-oxoacyl-[acyl-carrier-protein] synthase II